MKNVIYQSKFIPMKSLNNLYIEMTAKYCNQHCKHCYIDFPKYKTPEDFISTDTINNALNDTKNEKIKCIYLTGAEPMTHPDFNAILRLCLKYSNVCICTNGSFINEKKARFLKKVEDESTNEIFFKISIDHYDEVKNDDIRYRGAYRQAIFAIKHLYKYNFYPIVSVTNYYQEDETSLFENFSTVFEKFDIKLDKAHFNVVPYHDKNMIINDLIEVKTENTDCSCGRILTTKGVYSCPFLSDDYRGRCGSNFKDYANKCPIETSFCATCMKIKSPVFGIDYSVFEQ